MFFTFKGEIHGVKNFYGVNYLHMMQFFKANFKNGIEIKNQNIMNDVIKLQVSCYLLSMDTFVYQFHEYWHSRNTHFQTKKVNI